MNIHKETVLPTSVFITTNFVLDTDAGKVSHHERKALTTVTTLERTLTENDITPKLPQLPEPTRSFMWDYLTAHEMKNHKVDLAFFNGSPFGITLSVLKHAKTIVDIPAHNIETSIEEFERYNEIGTYPLSHMTDPFLWNIFSQHIQNADVVLCPSKLSADYISTKLSLKNKTRVIPYGCFLPEKKMINPPTEFNVVHVGDNWTDKGQLYLIQAWHKLKQNQKFSGNLFIAGRGTKMWFPFGVFSQEHVDNVGKMYNSCSVYVQPSVTEGFGIPVLEAMAYARPVIVTEGAGVYELVDDGKEGFVVPIRNPDVIKEKIQYFHDNPDEIQRMGDNARKKAEKYSWKIVESRYQKLIEEVLNET